MTAELNLIGRVAAGLIRTTLDDGRTEPGCARFLVHALGTEEVVAIVGAIENDLSLASRIEICLPRYRFEGLEGVRPELLTERATTELRHAECDREGRLMVLSDDSQLQSMAQVEKLDADTLLDESRAPRWIDAASEDLALTDEDKLHWQAALTALLRLGKASLRQVAHYLSATAAEWAAGSTLPRALGHSLPALRIPRFDAIFDEIPSARRQQPSQWKSRFESHWRRDSYIAKRDTSQLPFARARLQEKLEELRESLRDEVSLALQAYIDARDGVSDASLALFHIDWSELATFFEEAQKSDGRHIGVETANFYKIRAEELLTDAERDYLPQFAEQRGQSLTQTPDDETFYALHAQELREESRLAALWERFIFGQRVECKDLLDGLVQCLRRIYQPGSNARQVLVVEGQEKQKSNFLPLNDDACMLFATQYRGLSTALNGLVEFRNVLAFDYPSFKDDIEKYARRQADGTSRRARQLSFKVWLESQEADETPVRSSELKLIWECNLSAVGTGFAEDLDRLETNMAGTPLVRCRVGRPRIGTRGRPSGIDLSDLSTLEPEASRDRGGFIPARSKAQSLPKAWDSELDLMVKEELVAPAAADRLRTQFGAFEDAYRRSISDLRMTGYGAQSIAEQAQQFGSILALIVDEVSAQVALDRLLKPILEIGLAPVGGPSSARPAAIVLPWHPLRLAAAAARWTMLRSKLATLLGPGVTHFTDSGTLFFSDLRRALAEALRPEVVVGWIGPKPTVLSLTDALNGYSLHEPPVALDGISGATRDNVGPIAKQITELVQHYLKLQPHERDNLSVVLYNCDAAALPQAVVDSLRADAEREGDEAICQVLLRHRDEDRLRDLYQQLVTREVSDDSLHVSELTRDFMSRLRISIMVNTAVPATGNDGPPFDIVFCHDVVSRAAMLGWVEVKHITRGAADIDPGQWSKRRPIRRGDRDAIVYLSCPAQPTEGWEYLDALAALHQPEQARKARQNSSTLVPTRRTDVQDPATREVLEETHRLGSWVVNIDDLLDRRQLMDSRIRIIRYKHAPPGGRSLIISSQAPDSLLRATLRSRIRALDPDYDDDQLEELSRRLIDDANNVSGDIVLRAAKRGSNANELIGVVLSKYLVDHEIGIDQPKAWIFLDDYAAWLGQDEKRIADLLCLAPRIEASGEPVLDVVVTEAKYVAALSASAKAQDSAKQLKDTLSRLESSLIPNEAPADRSIWRARLTDMLLDGLREPGGAVEEVDWRTALRDGTCDVALRGYSHVFAHAAPGTGASVADAHLGVQGTETGYQERYGPETLRRLLRLYAERRDPGPLRSEVVGDRPQSSRGGPSPTATPEAIAPADMLEEAAPPTAEGGDIPAAAAVAAEDAAVPAEERDASAWPHLRFARLLDELSAAKSREVVDEAWLDEVADRCRNALLRYGMSARLEQKALTPNAALLKFKGSDELTVAAVERKLTELETTHALEVLSVRAEPGRVVLSIRRPHRQVLRLADVWRHWKVVAGEPNSRLLIAIKEDDGAELYLEPEPAPHTLVAGSTGSGKSVLVQNIILAIAATNRADQAEIVLIDPKAGVDYFAFEGLPHLKDGIIDDQTTALERLEALVSEMERRYSLFRERRVSNIRSYNERSDTKLPAIWLVHDEFADWMQVDSYRAGVEAAISRLGVKARAAGIYLVFAAQRPDATVFPMQLRSNLGNRLILRVDSAGTSDLSLGVKGGGAERLLGKGHLAAILGGGTEPIYAQVPFVSEDELARLVETLAEDLGA